MLHFETSAKVGTGVEDAFNSIADAIVNTRYKEELPPQLSGNNSVSLTEGAGGAGGAAGGGGKNGGKKKKKKCGC